MTQKRLGGADRKNSIIEAATKVFAEHGLQGAKTQQIAAAANVSEALIFRHFETKVMLYRAVLRRLIKEQDLIMSTVGTAETEQSSLGFIKMMRRYFEHCMQGRDAVNANSVRVYHASLAGDGNYASLLTRRSMRIAMKPMAAALEAARADGDIVGPAIDYANVSSIMANVGMNLMMSQMRDQPIFPYSKDPQVLVEQLLRFHGRGIGFTDAALDRLIPLSADEVRMDKDKAHDAAQSVTVATKPLAKLRKSATAKAKKKL